jgi:hypothetical protein
MGQMTIPKPLIIIIWTCQEMMAWMSMELIGSVAQQSSFLEID